MPLKLLPTNITNFKQLKTVRSDGNSYVCADKTGIIVDIVNGPNSILITRPPRFMKSATLSLLAHFFDIRDSEANAKLFEGMTICHEEHSKIWTAHQGQYTVILISLKDVKCDPFESGLYVYRKRISKLYSQYLDIQSSLSENERIYFTKIVERKANEDELHESLQSLIEFLYIYYQRKVVVLIDEYDTPLYSAHQYGCKQKKRSTQNFVNSQFELTLSFMTKLLGSTLKDNPYIERSVMTGVLRTAFASLVSTLNDITIYSVVSPKFAPYFGLTYTDIDDIVNQMGATIDTEAKKELEYWYNGYEIDNVKLYNPWSINQFLANYLEFGLKSPRPYWLQVGDHLALVEYMQKLYRGIRGELTQLMLDEVIEVGLNERTLMSDLEKGSEEAFWGLLVHCGYLTVMGATIAAEEYNCRLRIPNNEVKGAFAANIQRLSNHLLKDESLGALKKFLMSLVKGDMEAFKQGLTYYVMNTASYFDFRQKPIKRASHKVVKRRKQASESESAEEVITPEIIYHVYMLGLLSGLHGHYYRVRSNRESGYGRFDLALSPCKETNPGIIFEFKQVKKVKDLKSAAETALKQIEEGKYQTELENYGMKQGIHIGLGFCGKRFELVHKKVTYHPSAMFTQPHSPLSLEVMSSPHSASGTLSSERSMTKEPIKIYNVTLSPSKILHLEAHRTRGDGNCGFYTLPIAGDREGVRDALLSRSDDETIRKLVASEIRDAVISEHLPQALPDLNYYQTWREKYFAFQTTQDSLKRMESAPTVLDEIAKAINKHWQELVEHTESKKAFENFIREDTGKDGRLAYYQDPTQTSVIDALAQIKNLRIYIFQENTQDTSQLKLLTVRGPKQGTPLYLHHYYGTDTHFELLSGTTLADEITQKPTLGYEKQGFGKEEKLTATHLLSRDSPLRTDSYKEDFSSNVSSSSNAPRKRPR